VSIGTGLGGVQYSDPDALPTSLSAAHPATATKAMTLCGGNSSISA
jgi:hypothetical protein